MASTMGVEERGERLRHTVEGAGGALPCRVDTLLHHFGVGRDGADREALTRGLQRAGLVAEPDPSEAAPDHVVVLRSTRPAPAVAGPATAARATGGSSDGRWVDALKGDSMLSIGVSVAAFLVVCALVGFGFGRGRAIPDADATRARDEAVALSTRRAARPAYATASKRGRARGRSRGARAGLRSGERDGASRGRLRAIAAPVLPPAPSTPAAKPRPPVTAPRATPRAGTGR